MQTASSILVHDAFPDFDFSASGSSQRFRVLRTGNSDPNEARGGAINTSTQARLSRKPSNRAEYEHVRVDGEWKSGGDAFTFGRGLRVDRTGAGGMENAGTTPVRGAVPVGDATPTLPPRGQPLPRLRAAQLVLRPELSIGVVRDRRGRNGWL